MSKNLNSAFSIATGATSKGDSSTGNSGFPDRFLRRPDVCGMTSLPSSTLTEMVAKGEFPKPYKLSQRSSAWRESEVLEWMNSLEQAA